MRLFRRRKNYVESFDAFVERLDPLCAFMKMGKAEMRFREGKISKEKKREDMKKAVQDSSFLMALIKRGGMR